MNSTNGVESPRGSCRGPAALANEAGGTEDGPHLPVELVTIAVPRTTLVHEGHTYRVDHPEVLPIEAAAAYRRPGSRRLMAAPQMDSLPSAVVAGGCAV